MIEVGHLAVALDDPRLIAGWLVVLAALGLLAVVQARAAARAARPVLEQVERLARRVNTLGDGQHQLAGGLTHVAEAQAAAQAQTLRLMEQRLAEVTVQMGESLQGASTRTASSLGQLQERLDTIDRAQTKLEQLSNNVLSLQDILSNKQARGAFGEIQLHDLLAKALPPDAFTWQATLSNGKRADCLVHLPQPPGPLVIDSKFPLEPYEALQADAPNAERQFRTAVRAHIKAIAQKYILPGETADGAVMFLPSEAVYAELHANFADVVREGFEARVWIVSPTTCMATLNTLRAVLKDARMREQAGAIRAALRHLIRDVEQVTERAARLDSHLGQVRGDVDGVLTAARRAAGRAERLDVMDFGD